MRADMVLETPIKLFIILVAAVLVITLLRNLYSQITSGVDDLVPDKQKEGYELVDLEEASSGQLASMADACFEAGSKQPGLTESFGCYIVRGNFANVNAIDVMALSRHNTTVEISVGANAVFIDYHFPTGRVRVKS